MLPVKIGKYSRFKKRKPFYLDLAINKHYFFKGTSTMCMDP